MSGVTSCPGVDDVVRIAAMRNRVLRNLEITQCYAELSDGMRGRIGDAANWCTFATWASRQAGVTIRAEDLKAHLGRPSLFSPLFPPESVTRFRAGTIPDGTL